MCEEAWLNANVTLPQSYSIIIRGASRSILGESIELRTDSTGKISVAPIDSCGHEEADTSVVYAALQHAAQGEQVVIDSPDTDTLLAGICGLAVAVESQSASQAIVERVHLKCCPWFVSPATGKKPSKTPSRREQQQLRKSQVLSVGKIATVIMFGPATEMQFLPEGAGRVLTAAYAMGFFGGDTIERLHGYASKAGLDALLFMQAHVGTLATGYTGATVSGTTVSALENLLKGAAYLKHKSLFAVDAGDPAAWLAAQTLDEIAFVMYNENNRVAKHQVLSREQIEVQAAKMDARLTEWAHSYRQDPGCLDVRAPKSEHGWQRQPNQLKGLRAYGDTGEPVDGVARNAASSRERLAILAGSGRWLAASIS